MSDGAQSGPRCYNSNRYHDAPGTRPGLAVPSQMFCDACRERCANNDSADHRCRVCHDYSQPSVWAREPSDEFRSYGDSWG